MSDGRTSSDDVARPARLLKAVVIGLAIVLMLCGMVIAGTIVYRAVNMPEPKSVNFGVSPLPLPPGCSVDYVEAEGDRLIVQVGGNDTCRRVLIADLKTGALIGQFHFPNE